MAQRNDVTVELTREQAERLIDDPETELVVYYPDGTRIIVRISEVDLEQNLSVH